MATTTVTGSSTTYNAGLARLLRLDGRDLMATLADDGQPVTRLQAQHAHLGWSLVPVRGERVRLLHAGKVPDLAVLTDDTSVPDDRLRRIRPLPTLHGDRPVPAEGDYVRIQCGLPRHRTPRQLQAGDRLPGGSQSRGRVTNGTFRPLDR